MREDSSIYISRFRVHFGSRLCPNFNDIEPDKDPEGSREPGLESPAMGWEIHGKSLENPWTNPGFFGNPDFGKKSRFENKLAVLFEFF